MEWAIAKKTKIDAKSKIKSMIKKKKVPMHMNNHYQKAASASGLKVYSR